MSSRPFVKAANGLVHITDTNLDFEALEEAIAEWRSAEALADDDFYNRRTTHHEQVTRPAADSAASDVRDEAGLQLTWEQALAFADAIALAAADARKQQQAAEAAARRNPLLKGA